MGNICVVIPESRDHSKVELNDNEDTPQTQSSRSSGHGSLSFTKRFINLSSRRLVSMKKRRNLAQGGSSESSIWQRTILMGERCEPPVFSGLILYDEHGNSVQNFPCKPKSPLHPALTLTTVV